MVCCRTCSTPRVLYTYIMLERAPRLVCVCTIFGVFFRCSVPPRGFYTYVYIISYYVRPSVYYYYFRFSFCINDLRVRITLYAQHSIYKYMYISVYRGLQNKKGFKQQKKPTVE